ncbi:hypothetical protein HYPSUDRAFT_202338 [Hypholoma sublateritium FD-334 SS-4]|uniref:Uncharacterized protein n=1 Tax=Hypholoma sublateritium (strain FD-334 SS-4) TaxID=945553 RepID=A0A0D2P0U4_HYPSF|nr:hypothetical protein HYPSUDRAFT_202338 [Hypholoma sublateritium FD-334 SS-4]
MDRCSNPLLAAVAWALREAPLPPPDCTALAFTCRRSPSPSSTRPHYAVPTERPITVPLPSVRRLKTSLLRCAVLTHRPLVILHVLGRVPECRACISAPVPTNPRGCLAQSIVLILTLKHASHEPRVRKEIAAGLRNEGSGTSAAHSASRKRSTTPLVHQDQRRAYGRRLEHPHHPRQDYPQFRADMQAFNKPGDACKIYGRGLMQISEQRILIHTTNIHLVLKSPMVLKWLRDDAFAYQSAPLVRTHDRNKIPLVAYNTQGASCTSHTNHNHATPSP